MKTKVMSIMIMALFIMSVHIPAKGAEQKNFHNMLSVGASEVTESTEEGNEDWWEKYCDIKIEDRETYGIFFRILSEENHTLTVVDPQGYESDSGGYGGRIVIPSKIEYDGKIYEVGETEIMAFAYCHDLTLLSLPPTIKKVHSIFFCEALQTIQLCDGVEEICSSVHVCNELKYINLPASLKIIESSVCETGLLSAVIPEGTEVNDSFNNNPKLSFVELPEGRLSITESFNECPSISEIIVHSSIPEKYPSDSFLDVDKSNCVLRVPSGSVELYKAATGWSDYKLILPIVNSGTESVGTVEIPATEEYYTLDGIKRDGPAKGVNIVRNGSKIAKKFYK